MRLGRTQDPVRALIAVLATVVLVATSACSDDDDRDRTYAAQTATIGESLAVLGWNISVANLRFDASRDAVAVRASLCTQGEINAALLYATVSVVGTHAGLWTTRD